MKTVGLLFIILSVSFAGLMLGKKFIEKLSDMKKAEEIITALINGTENGRHTFEEISEEICNICGKEKTKQISEFTINGSLNGGQKLLSGSEEAKRAFKNALLVFGTCFASEQAKELEYYREIVRKEITLNEENYRKSAKLSGSLGILSGLLAAILLY